MFTKRTFFKPFVAVMLIATLLLQPSDALARGGRRGGGRRRGGHYGGGYHRYYRGHGHAGYYVAPIIGGFTYLLLYSLAAQQAQQRETTYIVTPAPSTTVIVAPEGTSADRIRVNIPNSNGSYTQVILHRSGNGYVGPQGEFYPGNPTVEQLRALYGN